MNDRTLAEGSSLPKDDPVFQLNPAQSLHPKYARIKVVRGTNAGEYITLNTNVTVLGRVSGIQIFDETASRQHARIIYQGDAYILEDLHSMNGTFVNGELLKEPMTLANGDSIGIGQTLMKFEIIDNLDGPHDFQDARKHGADHTVDEPTVRTYIFDTRMFRKP